MIASHELNMPDAVEAAYDGVAPVVADGESPATLADMDVLAGFAMNAPENVAIQTAPLDPAFAAVDPSEPAERDAPDMCEATAVAMPMSEPVTMCALPLPVEIEAASALDGEATASGNETEIASAMVSTPEPHQAMACVTDHATALLEPLGEAPATLIASDLAGSTIANVDQVSAERGDISAPAAVCAVATHVQIEPASVPESEAPTLAHADVATELANMPHAACADSSGTYNAPPAATKMDATNMTEYDTPAVAHAEVAAGIAVAIASEEGNVPRAHVPTTLAHESDVQPTARVLPSLAEMDTICVDEYAALHATVVNGEIDASAPTPITTEEWLAEGAAHAPSHEEGTSDMMVHARVVDSVAPPSVAPPIPDANPVPASTAAMEQYVMPASQVPMANPAYAMALKFAERGIGVFPLYGFNGKDCACGQPVGSPECTPGKHPRQLATFNGATTNSATITSWFTYFGSVNYGVATGKQVGSTGKMLVVVDIDWYKPEAQQTVEDLNQAGYVFPDTAEVLTGGGGRHLYYFAEIGAKFAGKLGAGVDFKGIGGYVVGPGSMHKSGALYGWEASSDLFDGQVIADLPKWVYEKFGKPDRMSVSKTAMGTALPPHIDNVSDAEMAEITADLQLISPLEYTTWCEVLMALKNRRNSEQMFGLADWWSQKAGYAGVDVVRKKWNSIKAEGGITIKSIKRLADADRYKDVNTDLIMSRKAGPQTPLAWREPEQIASCASPVDYPLDALPLVMQEAVKEVQEYTMAPVALVACSALASLSVAAQGLYDVQRDVGLSGPIALYMIAIAESGERKSTLDSFFTKPVRDFEDACAVAAKPEIVKFNTAAQAWEAKNKGILDKINQLAREAKDTSAQEAALAAHHATQPVAPLVPRIIYGDTTPEALTRGLAAGWPSGGVISSEGGAVFGGHGMGKESQMRNMAVINELWDGKPIRIDRRTSDSYTAKGTRLTVAVQVQPATLSAFMDGSGPLARGSGYIARFLIAYPESTQGTRAYKKAPAHWPMLDRFKDRIAEILSIMPTIEDGALKPAMLYLSDEAMAAWIDFYDEIEIQLGNGGGLRNVRDVASKTADNAARIAGLFHVLAGEVGSVSETNMRNGTRVAMWHLNESQRVFAGGIASAGHSDAQKLENWIVAYCKDNQVAEVSVKIISQFGPSALRKKAAQTSVLDELERLGRIKVGALPARTIHLNPALLN